MEQTELKIKAKKISELDNFDDRYTIQENADDAYVVLAYVKDGARENYKISLRTFFNTISQSSINENTLKTKLLELINSGEIELPRGEKGETGPQGPQGANGDGSDIDLNEIREQINNLQRLIDNYHKIYNIAYDLSHISYDTNNPSSIIYGSSATLKFIPNAGYKMPNTVEVNISSYSYNSVTKEIQLNNVTSDSNNISIKIVGELKDYSLLINTDHVSSIIEGGYQSNYHINDIINIILTPNSDYNLPNNINSISGAQLLEYNPSTGKLRIKCDGTGDITITINGVIRSYPISYSLSHIVSQLSNPTTINHGGSATLRFTPNTGYKMPANITNVIGANYTYSQASNSVMLSNATGNVLVSIAADIAQYSLSFNLSNITAQIISGEKPSYNVEDENITIRLTAANNYVLPESIPVTGANIISYDKTNGTLVIKCNGDGNIVINASGVLMYTYYFGIISPNGNNSDKIEVVFSTEPNDATVIDGISSVNIKDKSWMTSSTTCPFTIGTAFRISDNVIWGDESVMIIPTKYVTMSTSTFNDDNGTTGTFKNATSSAPFTFDTYKQIYIDAIPYYCIDLGNGIKPGSNYIIS